MSRSLTIPPTAWIGLFAIGAMWGASFLCIGLALREMPVMTLVAVRVVIGSAVLWLFVLARRLPLPRNPRTWVSIVVTGLLNNSLPFILIAWGQLHISSGLAAILNASAAVFGTLIAAALLRDEKLTGRKVLGVSLGFAGVAVALGLDSLRQFDLTSLGQLAILGGSLCYALAAVWSRLTLETAEPATVAAGMSGTAAVMLVPLALITDGPPVLALSAPALGAVLYLAVVSSGLVYLIYYRLLPVVGSANLTLVTLLVAPIAIVLGALVLGESLDTGDYLGFLLLAAGLSVIDGRLIARLRPVRA